jgi:hypothetical protein
MRGTWGYTSAITSDCAAVSDIPENHHFTNSTDATAAAVLRAGVDIGCDSYLAQPNLITNAVADGAITTSDVDTAITRLLTLRFMLGEFDPADQQPMRQIPPSVVCTAENLALAESAAAQGIVMLQNTNKALPLSRSAIRNVAVVGPTSNSSITNGGPNYNGIPCNGVGTGGEAITVLQALQAATPSMNVAYAQGCDIACQSTSGFNAAVQAASTADATVVVVGIDQTIEDEGLDRINITLPGFQNQLISQVCGASKGPCILVILSGGSQDISSVLPSVDAAFYAGFLGGTGSLALVDILFGDVVPSGRLTQTFYPAHFITDVSMFDMNMRPGPSAFPPGTNPGRTNRFYTGTPIFPFGFGLSYTTFVVSSPSGPETIPLAPVREYLSAAGEARRAAKLAELEEDEEAYATLAPAEKEAAGNMAASLAVLFPPRPAPLVASYSVNVTNTGDYDADYSVLGFLIPPQAGQNGVPLQQLFGFQRVHVPKGQTVTVWLGLSATDLTQVVPLPGESRAVSTSFERAVPPPGKWGKAESTRAMLEVGGFRVTRVPVVGDYRIRIGVRGPGIDAEKEVPETAFRVVDA